MRLVFITSVLFFSCFSLCAQNKTTLVARAGINFFNINGKDVAGERLDNNLKTGFHLGLLAEIPIGIDMYIQPGVLYTTKGADKFLNTTNKISISYIEVPVNFLYKPEVGTGRVIMGVGPYAAIGIGGNLIRENGNKTAIEFETSQSFPDYIVSPHRFRRFDAGANLLFGYEFSSHFSVQLNAALGLVNINPDIVNTPSDEASWKNTGFGISAGYRF